MLIANIVGLATIALIIWWFWLYKPEAKSALKTDVEIIVKDGVYSPAMINVPTGKPIQLRFTRLDESPCAEMLLIPELEISEQLLVNKETEIVLPALTIGEYKFHCQMNMYNGVINVVDEV